MIDFLKNMNALSKAEIVFVLISTLFYGVTLFGNGNFKSAYLVSSIAVIVATLFNPISTVLVAAVSAEAAIATAVIIALASATIATGALLATSPVPTPTPPPIVIAAFAALIAALFVYIAVYSTVKRAVEMSITKKRAVFSSLIEIMVILAAFYTVSHMVR